MAPSACYDKAPAERPPNNELLEAPRRFSANEMGDGEDITSETWRMEDSIWTTSLCEAATPQTTIADGAGCT
ncbi:hypothetical protein Tcan_16204 [Toxocara canis]|uniref:Uncharacterized protein n=1 Tax=Toxocara canis TaxID=6265 RepID=A0A0B2V8E4_TOXCA|nr:hypothetical protein Tcan_16204 [Toxocara canis]